MKGHNRCGCCDATSGELFQRRLDQADQPHRHARTKEAEMAGLRDAAKLTEQLEKLAAQLHTELTEAEMDFAELAALADDVGESADSLAAMLMAIDEALKGPLTERQDEDERADSPRRGGGRQTGRRHRTSATAATHDEPTKEELLDRARALDIPGRSAMSKDELLEAIRSEEEPSKQTLLDRAREADIPGRSDMSKEELSQALDAEQSLSKEELLERARAAEISGRSEMSKEELREALRSQ
jgi:hypothetical protein